jgi:hypothetical protein
VTVQIDRLVIEVPGLTPDEGRDLAERIGEALAKGSKGGLADRIGLTVPRGLDLDDLADRIAAGVRGQLK